MAEINFQLPDELVAEIDRAAVMLKRSRAEIVREAIEHFLDELEDHRLGLEAYRDSNDQLLEWSDVKRRYLANPPNDADKVGCDGT